MNTYLFFFIFLVLNILLVIFNKKIGRIINTFDVADGDRKLHKGKVPLIGGVIIFSNVILYFILINFLFKDIDTELNITNESNIFVPIVVGSILFFFVGLIDDKYNINPLLKFFLMIVILFLIVSLDSSINIRNISFSFTTSDYNIGKFSIPFTIICYLLLINSFNMFDGINLQSASYAIILFIFIIVNQVFVYFSVIVLLSLFFFSFLNLQNRSFMGDSGTYLISFIIGTIFIFAYNKNLISYTDQIFLFLMIPGFDLMRLFFLRISNGKHPFSPDRNHLHHILLNHYSYEITLIIILLMICFPIVLSLMFSNLLSIIIGFIGYLFTISYLQIRR